MRSVDDLNNIGDGVPEDIQTTIRNIDQTMDNDLEKIRNTTPATMLLYLAQKGTRYDQSYQDARTKDGRHN